MAGDCACACPATGSERRGCDRDLLDYGAVRPTVAVHRACVTRVTSLLPVTTLRGRKHRASGGIPAQGGTGARSPDFGGAPQLDAGRRAGSRSTRGQDSSCLRQTGIPLWQGSRHASMPRRRAGRGISRRPRSTIERTQRRNHAPARQVSHLCRELPGPAARGFPSLTRSLPFTGLRCGVFCTIGISEVKRMRSVPDPDTVQFRSARLIEGALRSSRPTRCRDRKNHVLNEMKKAESAAALVLDPNDIAYITSARSLKIFATASASSARTRARPPALSCPAPTRTR